MQRLGLMSPTAVRMIDDKPVSSMDAIALLLPDRWIGRKSTAR
jgi:hypothetical protein